VVFLWIGRLTLSSGDGGRFRRAASRLDLGPDRPVRTVKSCFSPADGIPSAKGKVHLQRLLVGGRGQGGLPETAEALRILATVQVAFALFPTQNPTAAGHLESLGDPFTCFAFSGDSSHRAATVSSTST